MKRYPVLLVVAGSLLWGTDSLFRRPLSRDLSPLTIVFLEHVILAAVVLLPIVRARREVAALDARGWGSLAFIALGGSVAATVLFTFAIKYGNPSVTVLLQKTQPLVAIALARALLGERPSRAFWIWLVPAIAGAYLVATPKWRAGLALDFEHPGAIAAALGAAALWGSCTVFGRYLIGRMPAATLTGMRFLVALPALGLLYALQAEDGRNLPDSAAGAALVCAMALVPGLAALVLYYKGLQSTPASLASVGELAFPVTAVAANWLLLGVRLEPSQLAGGIMLVASITVLGSGGRREATEKARTGGSAE